MITLRNRLSILPPILLFLALASAPFAANQAECDACAWPYTSGVNQDGACYPTYQGYQGALGTSCAAYCNTWQAAADTLQSMYAVKAFGDPIGGSAPLCECVRLNKGGFVSYKTRPHGTCDWGVSDATQAYWDSLAVRAAVTDSVKLAYLDSSVSLWTTFNSNVRAYETAGYNVTSCMSSALCESNYGWCTSNCGAGPIVYGWYSYDRKIYWLSGGAVHASGVDTGSHYGLHAVEGGGWVFCRPRALASGISAGFGTEMVSEGGSGAGGPASVDRSSMPSGGLP